MSQTTVAKYLVQRLKDMGITQIYGVPGENLAPFFQEIVKDKSISIMTTSSDQEAAFAADAQAKIKKSPSCFSTNFGSGSLQTVNALYGSYVEQSPVIVVNGATSLKKINQARDNGNLRTQTQQGNWTEIEIFRKVTVQAERIESSTFAPQQIDQCFTAAMTFSRPVYIEIPEDVFTQQCQAPQGRIVVKIEQSDPIQLEKSVREVVQRVNNSKNAVIIAGQEIQRYQVHDLFKQLVEKSRINYASTLSAKGVINEENERFIGVWNGQSSGKNTYDYVKNADIVILMGVSVTDIEIMGISIDDIRNMGKQIIFISRNSVKVENFHASPVTIRDFMTQIIRRIEQNEFKVQESKNFKYAMSEIKLDENSITYDSSVYQIAKSSIISKDSVIIGDTTLSIFPASLIPVDKDQFISQSTWCSKGYSLGAALGVFSSTGKRPIVFIGDGGFQQTPQSIISLVKVRSNAIIFVFNNGSLSIEQWSMNPKVFREPRDPFDQFNLVPRWNYIKFAESVGAQGFQVQNHKELDEVIKRVERSTNVSIIEIKIPQKDIPQITRWRINQ